jgi:hypothetical protein
MASSYSNRRMPSMGCRRFYADGVTEHEGPPHVRVRWGWFFTCVALGLTGILIGLLFTPVAGRTQYLAGVLGGVGTTLLLIGIVVLLERRIVDSAVKVVRSAAEEERLQTNREVRAQVRDLEDRLAALWATETATREDAEERQRETRRMTDEFSRRVVQQTTGADGPNA